jgi:hypothetical protein
MGFNVKSSGEWFKEKFIEGLCESPVFLYCGENSEKSIPLGKLKIATAMRQSNALLKIKS